MCRMLIALGNFNIEALIHDFILMAADQNERHENNIDGPYKHGDGWGTAYLENGQLKIFRSTQPVYEDDRINQFKNSKSNLVILHARKASKGRVDIRNVHPFECQLHGHRYLFFHNGTIHDPLPFDSDFTPKSDTDSERLFYYLLSGSHGQLSSDHLKAKLTQLKNYTAANFILTDGETNFAGNWYSENPNYYTMKLLRKPELVIVASEVLPHYRAENWIKLENRDVVLIPSRTDGISSTATMH